MNSIGITILFAVILAVTSATRRWALIGMMAGVLYLTQGQQVHVFGFNLFAYRFVELAGFLRILHKREFDFSRLNSIDKSFLLLYAYTTVIFVLRSSDGRFNQIGMATDAFLCYFTFRGLVGDVDDFRWFLRAFVILLAPYVTLLLIERIAGKNVFASMGGIEYGDWTRDGSRRCQGSFRHASLLGTLGASFLPLYIGLGFTGTDRRRAEIGMGLCLLIVWASNSGGPLNCAAIGVAGWLFWKVRTKMRFVRRTLMLGAATLALLMKAPIWYLPARASLITGGDGWHRSYLMDVSFRNFDKWWLVGIPIRETFDWFPYHLEVTGGADITNYFLSFGLTSGVAAAVLLIILLVQVFKQLGHALAAVRLHCPEPLGTEPVLWGLGVMLAAHITNWLGITYFDQIYAVWFMQLAAISNLSEHCISSCRAAIKDNSFALQQTGLNRPEVDYDSSAAGEGVPVPRTPFG